VPARGSITATLRRREGHENALDSGTGGLTKHRKILEMDEKGVNRSQLGALQEERKDEFLSSVVRGRLM